MSGWEKGLVTLVCGFYSTKSMLRQPDFLSTQIKTGKERSGYTRLPFKSYCARSDYMHTNVSPLHSFSRPTVHLCIKSIIIFVNDVKLFRRRLVSRNPILKEGAWTTRDKISLAQPDLFPEKGLAARVTTNRQNATRYRYSNTHSIHLQ